MLTTASVVLLQVQQQHDQQRPLKRSRSPPGADIRASGELVIEPADADVADAYRLSGEGCGLARNNSSTHVVDLASLVSVWQGLHRAHSNVEQSGNCLLFVRQLALHWKLQTP
jgi:hypothetical protein